MTDGPKRSRMQYHLLTYGWRGQRLSPHLLTQAIRESLWAYKAICLAVATVVDDARWKDAARRFELACEALHPNVTPRRGRGRPRRSKSAPRPAAPSDSESDPT